MRPVLLTDLDHMAHALIAIPPADRVALCQRVIACADTADRYRKHLHKAHPRFGTGTLVSAIPPGAPRGRIDRCTADYLACLRITLDCLAARAMYHNR